MNTNALKKFAQKARNLLLEDVSKRFLYWGFDKKGNILHTVEATGGGFLFRGEAHDDASIPPRWNSLVSAVGRHSVQDIIEEAAYTWFNRLMAIKILEQNGYDQPMLAYAAADLHEPVILRNAKKGIYPTSNPQEIQALKRKLAGANDDEALAALLVSYCRNHRLLNRIFGHLDDYTELLIPGAMLAKGGILELINDDSLISEAEYQEVELIGWLYQFYISDKKDDVFASFKKKKKARAEDIPAATQIFTPKWIVKYLVENTVGRIWLDLHPDSPIRETMKYLVEPDASTGSATVDEPIIKDVTQLKVLDPAVGSGHFLVVAFDLLMQIYLEEGYSKRKAVESIIDKNLYGLDICPRAAGLANFAILLKAAQYHAEVLRESHYPQVYAMPESFDFTQNQVEAFLGSGGTAQIDEVHTAFKTLKQGQNIGSALILNLSEESKVQLRNALDKTVEVSLDLDEQMTLQRMLPFAQVASILTDHFPAVVANPPYMGSKNMNADLVAYLNVNYPRSKSDLFAVFMELLPARTERRGKFGFITTPSWMFLGTYEKLRKYYVINFYYRSLLHLSRGVFGADFGAVACVIEKANSNERSGQYFRLLERTFQEFDTEDLHQLFKSALRDKSYKFKFSAYSKAIGTLGKSDPQGKQIYYSDINQSRFKQIPGNPIAYWISDEMINLFLDNPSLGETAEVKQGLLTTDNKRFIRSWFECDYKNIGFGFKNRLEAKQSNHKWFPINKGGDYRKWYGNIELVVNWWNDGEEITETVISKYPYLNGNPGLVVKTTNPYFHEAVTWTDLSSLGFVGRFLPHGFLFEKGGSCIFYKQAKGLLAYLNSPICKEILNLMNPTFHFQVGDVSKLPFIANADNNVIDGIDRCIEIAKYDWDLKETSWDFKTHPIFDGKNLQSLIEHRYNDIRVTWNDLTQEMHAIEQESNQILIDTHNLNSDLKAIIPVSEITLNFNPQYRYSNHKSEEELEILLLSDTICELISYAIGCIFGRFRLDIHGLNIAHPKPATEELDSYQYNGYTFEIDDDAIIPIMGSESPFSDDIVQRVQQFVLMVWGEDSYIENLNFINEALGEDLEKFLTKKFWDFHKKMYKKRPIYWQFASPKGAFKVLTYMHRMNRFTVQKIRQNYLFKQINYLESEIARLVANEASLNSTEARKLDRFRSNLLECRDYDLLLKDVADRQIEFDLDDGVVENYKLFEGVVSKI